MITECSERIMSEEYFDFIYEYNIEQLSAETEYVNSSICEQFASEKYVCVYTDRQDSPGLSINNYSYTSIPKLYGLQDFTAVSDTGALRLQNMSGFNLDGQGVIIGIIDTGIDYRSRVFRTVTGETRIISIWDQTIQEGNPPRNLRYGTEYTRQDIDKALEADNPYQIVPHRDINGHGTFLAGVACGTKDQQNLFVGVAPKADIVVVKLKEAKQYLRDFYLVTDDIDAYQENDIMLGIRYLQDVARQEDKPLVILLGLGSSFGEHAGGSPLSQMVDDIAGTTGRAVVACAGNQGNTRMHYRGRIEENGLYDDVEINVGENSDIKGFTLELWGQTPDVFTISIVSPLGESISQIPVGIGAGQEVGFVFENTKITIDYRIVEAGYGAELIFIRFIDPTPGVWTVRVFGTNILNGVFDMWLPLKEFADSEIYFLSSNPSNTVLEPGNAINVITVGAYDSRNNAIYAASGRGYTRIGYVKPDFIAPGVDVFGPALNIYGPDEINQRYTTKTGTSVSAAVVAGLAAMFFQWGIIRENEPYMKSIYIKNYLIRGAVRDGNVEYPNSASGYGKVNIYEAFRIITDI
ncbi:MAG: S8 family peptidase [Lachnospiraceae bacterium]|nr:S8 family peptidase [Lachnospiraceae bacterium]